MWWGQEESMVGESPTSVFKACHCPETQNESSTRTWMVNLAWTPISMLLCGSLRIERLRWGDSGASPFSLLTCPLLLVTHR